MIYAEAAAGSLPANAVALDDYETLAAACLDPGVWAYFSGGSADELTLSWNREAFSRRCLRSSSLYSMHNAHTRVRLLGRELAFPVLLAPVAWHRMASPQGEIATAQAAAALGGGMVLSTQSSTRLETVAECVADPDLLWFQLYIQRDRKFTAQLVSRAERAGYGALVLTVDAPVSGIRNREQRAAFQLPEGVESVNLAGMRGEAWKAPSLLDSPLFDGRLNDLPTWEDVAWLKSLTRLPLLLKGSLNGDELERAIAMGIDGIVLSNHGGRTLDTLPATLDMLPEAVRRVAGRVPLLMDGGIRRGTDVLKALALGADAVLIGRPYIYGLAVAGAAGVAHVLHILRAELEAAMTLTGCPTLADIGPQVLWQPDS